MPAVLSMSRGDTLRLTHDDVAYEPIAQPSALGALLFALDLLARDAVSFEGARYADRVAMQPALDAARQFGLILRRHAQRADRATPRLPESVRLESVHGWVHAAAVTAPAAESERFCWRLARALGAEPWCDGRPAIELQHQQFALFEGGYGEPAPAADKAAAGDPSIDAPDAHALTATSDDGVAPPAPSLDTEPPGDADDAPAA